MSDIVFILGAGASKECGGPLMQEFLEVADEIRLRGSIEEQFLKAIDTALAARNALQIVHSKSQLDLDNIESILGTFEMSKTLGVMPGDIGKSIDEVLESIRTLITVTLEESIWYGRGQKSYEKHTKPVDVLVPDGGYRELSDLLRTILETDKPKRSVSIITFNYDLAADVALLYQQIQPQYFLDDTDPQNGIPLLKLHGSTNWAACPTHKQVVPWRIVDYLNSGNGKRMFSSKDRVHRLKIGSDILTGRFNHCGDGVATEPFLVPPTANKVAYHETIERVWRRAAQELREAVYIIVVGYSMPETDVFFKHLYAIGTAGGRPLKSFVCVNSDYKVHERFKAMLGLDAIKKFSSVNGPFSNANRDIKRCLNI